MGTFARADSGTTRSNKKKIRTVRLLTACAGAAALVCGILQGGYEDTLAKAVRICLECVGIG